MLTQNWNNCLKKGKIKEKIFQEDFLEYLNIGFLDVSNEQEYQKSDIDIIAQVLSSIDVKPYNDRQYISLEEESVVENKKRGWMYESQAKYFAFVSTTTRTILILKNNIDFQNWWMANKENYNLITQKTERNNQVWHSTHRNIPLRDLNIAWYKKNLKTK